MANRCILSINKLDAFKQWLEEDGWTILETSNNITEVLRAKKEGRKFPLIVYQKFDAKVHLSIMERDEKIVRAFLRNKRTVKKQ